MLCPPPSIDLFAELNDYTNLRNLTQDWEQVSGNPIVLSQYDFYNVNYPYIDNSDKHFKFYLDKDTNREQVEDFYVYHTPTSITKSAGGIVSAKDINSIRYLSITDLVSTSVTPPYSGVVNPNVTSIPGGKFTFTLPDSTLQVSPAVRFEVHYSASYGIEPFTVIDTFNFVDFPTQYVGVNGFYFFRFIYLDYNGKELIYDSPIKYINFSGENTGNQNSLITDDVVVTGGIFSKITKVTRYTNKIVNTPITNAHATGNSLGNFIGILRYTNTNKSVLGVYGIAHGNQYTKLTSLVRFNPSGIGSSI